MQTQVRNSVGLVWGGADSSVKAVEAEVEVWLLNARCGGHSQRSSVPMPQCPGAFPPGQCGSAWRDVQETVDSRAPGHLPAVPEWLAVALSGSRPRNSKWGTEHGGVLVEQRVIGW
ncbi:hypothetical protein MHUMG1_01822 [Metarhizium humberi]|uniref:Uncharacterized protein n=1 Tax=Metarhizium humberi TaxID=2596975 RepID=A0A9P8MI82_9HYPO|nr:hypothetical protein MHUMG1_01822 [Metarhizium humberi]